MFIKLTEARRDTALTINAGLISAIDIMPNHHTALYMNGMQDYFPVRETPEQIMEMIENARN